MTGWILLGWSLSALVWIWSRLASQCQVVRLRRDLDEANAAREDWRKCASEERLGKEKVSAYHSQAVQQVDRLDGLLTTALKNAEQLRAEANAWQQKYWELCDGVRSLAGTTVLDGPEPTGPGPCDCREDCSICAANQSPIIDTTAPQAVDA